MTKNELKWRLKDLPDASGIAELVKQGVVTKEEARELLFNKETPSKNNESDIVKALKKQIEFLEELVKDLAQKSTETRTIYQTVERYKPYWEKYSPYWMSVGGSVGSAVSGKADINLTSYTNKLIG